MKKLFVLGDSISIHYGPFLEMYSKGFYEYDRKGYIKGAYDIYTRLVEGFDINKCTPVNGGDSGQCLQYIKDNPDIEYDIFLLNCGAHDIRTKDGKIQVEANVYEKNLREIIPIIKKNGKKLIWVTTAPVDDEIHDKFCPSMQRYNRDVVKYNEIASKVMMENNVPIIDLYNFTKNIDLPLYEDHVHYNFEVRRLQASFILGAILALDKE